MKKIVIFDFDNTITKEDSFNDFLKYTFGKKKFYLTMLKKCIKIMLYKTNLISNAKVKTDIFKAFYKNKKYETYQTDCENYVKNRLNDIINNNIKDIIVQYQNKKYEMVILSASFKEWIEPWAQSNGFNMVICSSFAISNGIINGKIEEKNSCYGENKLRMLLNYIPNIDKEYSEIIAFGDSKSDKYYLNKATTAFLIKKGNLKPINEYAVVTDGLWRKSLSAIRSLGKKGVNVIVTGDTHLSTGMWSRYCFKRRKVSNLNQDEPKFREKFLEILYNCPKKPVLFPMEVSIILWCSQNMKLIKNLCYILLPPKKSMEIALSKSLTVRHAQKINIPCPKTFYPKNAQELKELIASEEMSDYVIKPYHGSGSAGLLYGSESKDVNLNEHWNKYGDLILQERIPAQGEGVGVSVIFDRNHNVKAYFAHKRIEQYPNSGGPSTQRIGIENKDLVNKSIKLLKSLNWVGVAMVEWKYNPNINDYVLMEINPRFWGSLELAVRSGVDFPYLYYQIAKNREVSKIIKYDLNYNCRWLIPGDILRYLTKKDRESFKKFCKGIFKNSEEWDKNDKRGFFASIWCQGLLILNPKYWKYIRK